MYATTGDRVNVLKSVHEAFVTCAPLSHVRKDSGEIAAQNVIVDTAGT